MNREQDAVGTEQDTNHDEIKDETMNEDEIRNDERLKVQRELNKLMRQLEPGNPRRKGVSEAKTVIAENSPNRDEE